MNSINKMAVEWHRQSPTKPLSIDGEFCKKAKRKFLLDNSSEDLCSLSTSWSASVAGRVSSWKVACRRWVQHLLTGCDDRVIPLSCYPLNPVVAELFTYCASFYNYHLSKWTNYNYNWFGLVLPDYRRPLPLLLRCTVVSSLLALLFCFSLST